MKPKNIYGWNGFELASANISLGLTPSLGGRIMSFMFKEHELLFVDPSHTGETFDPQKWNDLAQAKTSLGFRVWGGDKTWVAPQKDWFLGIPPLDLDAAPYTFVFQDEEAVMTSPVCRETGLQIIRRVRINESKVHVTEEIYNRTTHPIKKGLWNVTQVNKPCSFEIPSEPQAFRSYHDEDQTLPPFVDSLEPKDGHLTIDCSYGNLFKVGGMPAAGEVLIHIPVGNQKIVWKKTFSYDPRAEYAHGSVVEIFNSPSYPYAEIELHAPLKTLMPGEFVKLEQTWQIGYVTQ